MSFEVAVVTQLHQEPFSNKMGKYWPKKKKKKENNSFHIIQNLKNAYFLHSLLSLLCFHTTLSRSMSKQFIRHN